MQNRLFEFLINKTGQKNAPEVTPVWVNENGENDPVKALDIKQATTPRTLAEHLFGRTMTSDTQSVDPRTGEAKLETISNYKPGFFDNLNAGMNENYNSEFKTSNLAPSGKSLGYKLGEGLGSIARGLAGWGGDAFTAGYQGLDAGLNRQGIRIGDQLYRNDLIRTQQQTLQNNPNFAKLPEEEQQTQLQAIADNINGMRGYLSQNAYGNLIKSQQIRDNADWRKMYFDTQQKNLKEQQEWRKQQAQMQRAENAANRAVTMRGQDINYKLGQDRIEASLGNKLDKTSQKAIMENAQTISDIQAGLQLLEQNPNAYSWVKGKLGADITNRIDPKGIRTRTAIDNITAVYRKWLTGAQMSDAERKAYERFLPAPTDNYQTVKAKLEGMLDSIQRRNDVIMGGYNIGSKINSDPLGIL